MYQITLILLLAITPLLTWLKELKLDRAHYDEIHKDSEQLPFFTQLWDEGKHYA